jgi:hypothetical protein
MAALAAPAVRVAEARTARVPVSTNCTVPVGALPEPCAATLTASVSLFVGWFFRRCTAPPAWRSHRDPGLFQILTGGFPANAYALLDAPQRPSQSSQRDDLLFLIFFQDVAHIDGR